MTAIADRAGWRTDRPFFMAVFSVMALTILAGFANSGRDFHYNYAGLPLMLQVHAAVMTSWLVFLVVQSGLVVSNSLALHRRLGWIGAAGAGLLVILAVATTIYAETAHLVPSFFPKSIFLFMNVLGVVFFGGVTAAAIRLRNRPDWHKRLMLSATMLITTPGLGRLLPMDSFGAAAPLILFLTAFGFLAVGMVYDLTTRRRVHPAYWWGAGAYVAFIVATPAIAFSPIGQGAVAALTKGH